MGVIIWLIVGIIASLLVIRITGATENSDRLLNLIVGIIGALVGGFATNLVMFFPPFGFSWASLLVSVLGAVVFLGILSAVRR